jgi:gluconate kinase
MNENLRNKILKDIEMITKAIQIKDNKNALTIFTVIKNSYVGILRDLEKSLLPIFNETSFDLYTSSIKVRQETNYENLYLNLEVLKSKLEFLSFGVQPYSTKSITDASFQLDDSKILLVQLSKKVQVKEVMNHIESMKGLTLLELKTLREKVEHLDSILQNKTLKRLDKWEKCNEIGKWIFDKSPDVSLEVLPLFFQLIE